MIAFTHYVNVENNRVYYGNLDRPPIINELGQNALKKALIENKNKLKFIQEILSFQNESHKIDVDETNLVDISKEFDLVEDFFRISAVENPSMDDAVVMVEQLKKYLFDNVKGDEGVTVSYIKNIKSLF